MTIFTEVEAMSSDAALLRSAETIIRAVVASGQQPSAWELLQLLEDQLDAKARWVIERALMAVEEDKTLRVSDRSYVSSIRESEDLRQALAGAARPGRQIESSIDALLASSRVYRGKEAFQEMIRFMGRFKDYAPFNNMLVKIQNPSCGFYATQRDWNRRFGRTLKEDARPMLILAPMHPVLLVYDLDQTEGRALPEELQEFARFDGEWNGVWLSKTVENAWRRDLIRIEFKALSSVNAGFATLAWGRGGAALRIVVHSELDEKSRYGVLSHELAHIYLGHLGGLDEHWPCRIGLSRDTMEIEAEATAYIVTCRLGLQGASPQYISRHLTDAALQAVSLDSIAKVAGRIEDMARKTLSPRRSRDGERVT